MPAFSEEPEVALSLESLGNVASIVYDLRDRLAPGTGAGVDLEAVHLAACCHWTRWRLLPEQDGQWDVNALIGLLSIVHAVRPGAVPEPFRGRFAASPPALQPPDEVLHSVGLVLFRAAVHARDEERLAQAVALLAAACEAAPAGRVDPAMTFNLGSAYAELHALGGDPKMLTAAIALMREAVAAVPPGRPVPETMLTTLAATQSRQERSVPGAPAALRPDGDPEQLDAFITRTRHALRSADGPEPERSIHRVNLGNALRMRFEVRGDLEDLTESMTCLREAVETRDDDALRHLAASALALDHLDRFTDAADHADLDQATALARFSIEGSDPRAATHGQVLTNLAAVLHARYRTYGEPADLDEAVRHLEHAVAATPPHQHDHPVMRIKLAVALRDRGQHTGRTADLTRAAELLRAVAGRSPADGRDGQLARLELGTLLTRLSGGPGPAIAEATAYYRGTALTPTHDTRTRMLAAHGWAMGSAIGGDLRQARQACAVALDDLLPRLAGHELGRASREFRLSLLGAVARTAAAVEIRAGRPREALTRLEQGRCVLLAQALRLRDRHRDLAEAAPELSTRLERVRAELAADGGRIADRRAAAEEYEEVVARIRALPGFRRFERPPDWRRLSAAAAHGPVVVVNASPLGCDALLLRRRRMRTTVEVVGLPAVTDQDVTRRANAFLAAVEALSSERTSLADRLEHDRVVNATLDWLGEHIAGPVLARLGLRRPMRPGGRWPRLWWCPTGPLSLLPLHAARLRTPDGGTGYVDDLVVCSYTPTLDSLLRARARPAPPPGRWSAAAVGVPDPPPPATATSTGAAPPRPLPAVDEELAAVAELPAEVLRLRDAQAGPRAVLDALRTRTHAHLACHGVHDPADPSGSGLLLHDGPLTVRELAAERMPDAEFAYLSACHTAAPGLRLTDEMITLASAFQLCGYRQVIGTLWTVADAIAPRLAGDVYRAMAAVPPDGAARALHRATRALRGQPHWAAPLFWASVIHIGP